MQITGKRGSLHVIREKSLLVLGCAMTPSIFCKLTAYLEANEYDVFVDNSYVKRFVPANHIF